MPEENKDVTPDPSPAPADDVKSVPSPDTAADQSDSPTDADVEGSSTEDAKPELSLEEEIENAFAEEKGEDKPNKTKAEEETEDKAKEPDPEKEKEPETEDLTAVPEDVKEGTKAHERFQKLANDNKEKGAKIETLTSTVNDMREMIKDAGLKPDTFKELIEYARIANTGDPKEALKMLDNERQQLILKIGEPIEPPSILADFPELQKRVTDYDLSEQDAIKLAAAQVREQSQKQADEKAQADQNQEESFQDAVKANSDKVTEMELKWQENDVDYSAKKDLLMQKLPEIQKQSPDLWPTLVQDYYDMITLSLASSKKTLNPEPPVTKGDTGQGGQEEPKSLGEAIDRALGVSP